MVTCRLQDGVVDQNYQCSICFDVLKDVCLTKCCGQHYCSLCLTEWNEKYGKKTCPQCRKQNFSYIKNKSLTREINLYSKRTHRTPSSYSDQQVGFDPSQKYTCTMCAVEPLKVPCLTECCGQHFCHTCLTDWLHTQPQKICPYCRQENTVYIVNKSLKREIEELFIRCDHLRDGCGWVGRAERLEEHLGSCDYVNVECPFKHCYQECKRKHLEKHKKKCRHRREKCTHCGLVVSHSAIYLHYDECPEVILCCPNHCSQEKIKRRELKIHYETCPLEPVHCQFKDAGCMDMIMRRDMESHMEKNVQKHMLLLQQQNRSLHSENCQLRKANQRLHKWNGELNSILEGLGYTQ